MRTLSFIFRLILFIPCLVLVLAHAWIVFPLLSIVSLAYDGDYETFKNDIKQWTICLPREYVRRMLAY